MLVFWTLLAASAVVCSFISASPQEQREWEHSPAHVTSGRGLPQAGGDHCAALADQPLLGTLAEGNFSRGLTKDCWGHVGNDSNASYLLCPGTASTLTSGRGHHPPPIQNVIPNFFHCCVWGVGGGQLFWRVETMVHPTQYYAHRWGLATCRSRHKDSFLRASQRRSWACRLLLQPKTSLISCPGWPTFQND